MPKGIYYDIKNDFFHVLETLKEAEAEAKGLVLIRVSESEAVLNQLMRRMIEEAYFEARSMEGEMLRTYYDPFSPGEKERAMSEFRHAATQLAIPYQRIK